jgi:hypothetical protein
LGREKKGSRTQSESVATETTARDNKRILFESTALQLRVRYYNYAPIHYISALAVPPFFFLYFVIFITKRTTLMMTVGRPIPSPTPKAILSLPEMPLLPNEVDVGSGVDDAVVGLVVVSADGEGVGDKKVEEDKVLELELPVPARHSYLTPFTTLLVVCTSTHCSA